MLVPYLFLFLMLSTLVVLPMLLYNHPKYLTFLVRIRYLEKGRMFVASLLGVFVCIFHMIYYNIYPLEKGLLLSSLYVFLSFMGKLNLRFLQKLRASKIGMVTFAILTIAFAFTPQLFSCAATMAFILMFACALPSKIKARKIGVSLVADCSYAKSSDSQKEGRKDLI